MSTSTAPSEPVTHQDDHNAKDLLRFITCGSVDDGKSTLIGRLMLETGAVFEDQIEALRNDSKRHGTTDADIDPALLLDGLEDERQQGITIDVAYRYFATPKRKFIIGDTPGHEQFTRNMATGASNADLAILLVDATKGVSIQTKRHAFIVSLLGIRHVILAVNKMDLVDFRQEVFDDICQAFRNFATKLDIPDIRFVPLSALEGDNVTEPSSNTLWYSDGSLLHVLESIYVGADRNQKDFRFPVQWVNRPHADFRGFSGRIASGTVRVGDEVLVLPSKKRSKVDRIVTMDGDLPEASAGLSVTLNLTDEIDVTRGDMIVRPGNQPIVSRNADCMLVWMSETPLSAHKQYWFKNGGGLRSVCEVESIRYAVDVNTLHRTPQTSLELNDIGRCELATHQPIMFDPYRINRETGSFILVDRMTHETVAAGMFLPPQSSTPDQLPKASQFHPVSSKVASEDRARVYGHRPLTFLLTGPCASGKTSLALEMEKYFFEAQKVVSVLDEENLRSGLCADLDFSGEGCSEVLRRAAEIAKFLNDSGQVCIAPFIAPEQTMRERFKEIVGADRCYHIHLATPVETCRRRDEKGRYEAADQGKLRSFPGVGSAYETPDHADLVLSLDDGEITRCTLLKMSEWLERIGHDFHRKSKPTNRCR